MEKNVGGIFSALRIIGGFLLVGFGIMSFYLGLSADSINALMVGMLVIMGAAILITGIIKKCPLNYALGRNTCKNNSE